MAVLWSLRSASKVHWSELSDATSDDEKEGKVTDLEFFKSLQKKWGKLFFRDCKTLGLEVEGKIAEGGQAEIFNASYYDGRDRQRCVMKVFKEGYRLRDLQKQWPLGMLQNRSDYVNSCKILGANFLENGRFAFRMERYEGDLRKLIDSRMQQNGNQSPPFTEKEARLIMLDIAVGMESLHRHKIIHRDLKASNVFIHWREKNAFHPVHNPFVCIVGDFECSVGVVGTGYWRAPEILQAVQACDIRSHLFSEKSDVYSFAMTCYEVLTGCIPFENFSGICYDPVIQGKRPKLPRHVNPMLKTLVERCWHGNPLERPSFSDMIEELR